jgi:hypothetical protein
MVILGAGLWCVVADSKEAVSSAPATQSGSNNVAPSDLVASFYRALVQENPPTYEQETELFSSSGLRTQAIGKDKVPERSPILLELFRKHKDLFFPKNMKGKKNLEYVRISSPFKFLGTPDTMDPSRKGGEYVVALFVDDVEAHPARNRSLVFSIDGGKLDGDAIYIGGFDGEMTYEKYFDVKWAIEHSATQEAD